MGLWTTVMWIAVVLHRTSGSTQSKFKAAVYEHVVISPENPTGDFTREEAFFWMSKNLKVFADEAAIAAEKGSQIIVFPEYGITGFDQSRDSMIPFLEDIPDPKEREWQPCKNPGPETLVLNKLSCIAQENNIYLVANMGDIKKCDGGLNCPADKRFQFNTNVVFDKKGQLIARYHKYHLYDESPLFDPAPKVEYSYFDTPFGRFGTVVCFDIMNFYPTQTLLQVYKVKTLIVTSAWNVFYPFVIPTQMYSGIAKRNAINVIASNVRNGPYMMAGSGIFGQGAEALSDPNFRSPHGVLLTCELNVKVSDHGKSKRKLMPIFDDSSKLAYRNKTHNGTYDFGFNTSFTVLSGKSGVAVVCGARETVCCAANYTFGHHDTNEIFILSATDFLMTDLGYLHMQFCAVNRCLTSDLNSCGRSVTHSKTTFSYLKLQGFFPEYLLFPFVSTSPYGNITTVSEMDHYTFDTNKGILESNSLEHPLLAAVVFNSIYVEDKSQPSLGTGSASSSRVSMTVLVVTCVFSVFIEMRRL